MSATNIGFHQQWIINNPDHTPIDFFYHFSFINRQFAHNAYYSSLEKLSKDNNLSSEDAAVIARHIKSWNSNELKDVIDKFWQSKRFKLNQADLANVSIKGANSLLSHSVRKMTHSTIEYIEELGTFTSEGASRKTNGSSSKEHIESILNSSVPSKRQCDKDSQERNHLENEGEEGDVGKLTNGAEFEEGHLKSNTSKDGRQEDNGNMSDSSSSVAGREEMSNIFLVDDELETQTLEELNDISEREDNLEERAEEADISILNEPYVAEIDEAPLMSSDDWTTVMAKIRRYRSKIPKSQQIFDPLYYFIIDHSGQHGPTTKLLEQNLASICASLPKEVNFSLPTLSEKETDFLDQVVMAEAIEDIEAGTTEERRVKKLVSRIIESVIMPTKDEMSEIEHTSRNVMPILDATVGHDKRFRVHYGEKSLKETAVRRNKGGDPSKRARMGYKVDVLVEFSGLWKPTLGCGEVSGGLPHCSRSKEWATTLKLALELRDVWEVAQKELEGVDATNLVVWGFIVVERRLRIYALAVAGGLFHLVLTYHSSIPSSVDDLWNIQVTYLAMVAFYDKLEMTRKVLCDLNRQKVILARSGVKRKYMQEKQPEVANTPKTTKRPR